MLFLICIMEKVNIKVIIAWKDGILWKALCSVLCAN